MLFEDEKHEPRTDNKISSKHLIQTYQLWKSQLLFSQAEHIEDRIFNVFPDSTVASQIVSDEMYHEHDNFQRNPTFTLIHLYSYYCSS